MLGRAWPLHLALPKYGPRLFAAARQGPLRKPVPWSMRTLGSALNTGPMFDPAEWHTVRALRATATWFKPWGTNHGYLPVTAGRPAHGHPTFGQSTARHPRPATLKAGGTFPWPASPDLVFSPYFPPALLHSQWPLRAWGRPRRLPRQPEKCFGGRELRQPRRLIFSLIRLRHRGDRPAAGMLSGKRRIARHQNRRHGEHQSASERRLCGADHRANCGRRVHPRTLAVSRKPPSLSPPTTWTPGDLSLDAAR